MNKRFIDESSVKFIEEIIERAIVEDVGNGDHTSLSCIPAYAEGKAKLLVKQDGVIAGIEVAKMVFQKFDKKIVFESYFGDGQSIRKGDVIFSVSGNVRSILMAERLTLNIMQRMSGIASETRKYVKKIEGTKARILDTRKTTPNFRILEKIAVKTGGGENHRMGLYDMILIKDNHIDFAGGIQNALESVEKYKLENEVFSNLEVEIEARSLSDIEQIMKTGKVNRILIDNFSVENTEKAVKLIDNKYLTESSGGINYENIRDYAECGVDYISVGALTHHIRSLDLSLKAF